MGSVRFSIEVFLSSSEEEDRSTEIEENLEETSGVYKGESEGVEGFFMKFLGDTLGEILIVVMLGVELLRGDVAGDSKLSTENV